MKKGAWRIIFWLLGLVTIALVLIRTGRYTLEGDTGVDSTGPQGLAAAASLLQKAGFEVRLSSRPPTSSGSAIIAPVEDPGLSISFIRFLGQQAPPKSRILVLELPVTNRIPDRVMVGYGSTGIGTVERLRTIRSQGFFVPDGINDTEPASKNRGLIAAYRKHGTLVPVLYNLTFNRTETPDDDFGADGPEIMQVATGKTDRTIFRIPNATFIQNERIDREQSAAVFLGLVNKIFPDKSKPIVFVTRYTGRGTPSLIEQLGDFWHGAYNQVLMLVAVMFVTYAVRFGLPYTNRAPQGGIIDTTRSIAAFTERRNQDHWVVMQYWESVVSHLERTLQVSREQLLADPETHLGKERAQALIQAQAILSLPPIDSQRSTEVMHLLNRALISG